MRRRRSGWTWAAACAAEERALSSHAWGAGDGQAEVLLSMVWGNSEDVATAIEPHSCGEVLAPLRARWPGLHTPEKCAPAWRGVARELWQELGLDVDLRSARPGRMVDLTPYHVHVERDPSRPYYHERALHPPDPDLAASIERLGRPLRLLILVPDAAGRLVVVAGRRRTAAARLAVRDELGRAVARIVDCVDAGMDATALAPPAIWFGENDDRRCPSLWTDGPHEGRLLGLLRAEVVSPESAAAIFAQNVDNDHARPETPLSLARQIAAVRQGLGCTIQEAGAVKGLKSDTAANLFALLSLTPELQGLVEEGALDVSEGYKLARVDPAKQREVYEATRQFSPVKVRIAAIAALAAGRELPAAAVPAVRPPGPRRVREAGRRATKLPPVDGARAGARAVFRLLAGEAPDAALAGVPDECRTEILDLLGGQS